MAYRNAEIVRYIEMALKFRAQRRTAHFPMWAAQNVKTCRNLIAIRRAEAAQDAGVLACNAIAADLQRWGTTA